MDEHPINDDVPSTATDSSRNEMTSLLENNHASNELDSNATESLRILRSYLCQPYPNFSMLNCSSTFPQLYPNNTLGQLSYCLVCGSGFSKLSELDSHILQCHVSKTFQFTSVESKGKTFNSPESDNKARSYSSSNDSTTPSSFTSQSLSALKNSIDFNSHLSNASYNLLNSSLQHPFESSIHVPWMMHKASTSSEEANNKHLPCNSVQPLTLPPQLTMSSANSFLAYQAMINAMLSSGINLHRPFESHSYNKNPTKSEDNREKDFVQKSPKEKYFSLPPSNFRKQLSVPTDNFDKEILTPDAYKPNPSTNSSHNVKNENSYQTDSSEMYSSSTVASDSSKKNKVGHVNAKSIEQHISKLITNNEKILTNPDLERVKPRRVFRRSSFDPSSLSSYFENSSDQPPEIDVNMEKVRSQVDVNHSHFANAPFSLNKVVELTRVPPPSCSTYPTTTEPNNKLGSSSNVADYQSNVQGKQSFLGKRNMSVELVRPSGKKARRTSFFECQECGVRYRKEDNYRIHKAIYCKYKQERFGQRGKIGHSSVFPMSKNQPLLLTNDTPRHCEATKVSYALPPYSLGNFEERVTHGKVNETSFEVAQSDASQKKTLVFPREKMIKGKIEKDREIVYQNRSVDFKQTSCSPKDIPHCDADNLSKSNNLIPVTSTNPEGNKISSSEFYSETNSDDSLIPRSNYKLLVHQLSLRNKYDLGFTDKSSRTFTSSKSPLTNQCDSPDSRSLAQTTKEISSQPHKFINSSSMIHPVFPRSDAKSHTKQGFSQENTFHEGDAVMTDKTIAQTAANSEVSGASINEDSRSSLSSSTSQQKETSSEPPTASILTPGNDSFKKKLLPHNEAILNGDCCVSFCSVVSPQPACIEASKISMYRDWTVSDPIMIPDGLTVEHVLKGWRKSKTNYSRGLTTCALKEIALSTTESKEHERQSKRRLTEGRASPSSGPATESTTDNHNEPKTSAAHPNLMNPICTNFTYTTCHRGTHSCYYNSMQEVEVINGVVPLGCTLSDTTYSSKVTDNYPDESGGKQVEDSNELPKESRNSTIGECANKYDLIKQQNTLNPTSISSTSSPIHSEAVHNGMMCKDNILGGCSLCSMKAGKNLPDLPGVVDKSKQCSDSCGRTPGQLPVTSLEPCFPPTSSKSFLETEKDSKKASHDVTHNIVATATSGDRKRLLSEVVDDVIKSAALQTKGSNKRENNQSAPHSRSPCHEAQGQLGLVEFNSGNSTEENMTSKDCGLFSSSMQGSFSPTSPSKSDSDDQNTAFNERKDYNEVNPDISSQSRPFRCDDCSVAFRISGHLAKHLRSKGHAIVVQKKFLSRLKEQQSDLYAGRFPNSSDVESKRRTASASDDAAEAISNVISYSLCSPIQQSHPAIVRTRSDGDDQETDSQSMDNLSEKGSSTEEETPLLRPYKCITCKVAFRFQGHLDRHYRSNSHYLAASQSMQEQLRTNQLDLKPAHVDGEPGSIFTKCIPIQHHT